MILIAWRKGTFCLAAEEDGGVGGFAGMKKLGIDAMLDYMTCQRSS